MNLRKKILGVGLVAASVLAATPASASRWVDIGSYRGFEYYVDVDREQVRGSFWAAPIAVRSNGNTYLGMAAINCNNYSVKIQIGNNVNDWRRINPSTPMDFVGRRVCR